MSSNYLTTHRQFEMDSRLENTNALVEEKKKALEEDAERELDKKMGNTLADFQIWPAWSVESTDKPDIPIHTLTEKVIFKP